MNSKKILASVVLFSFFGSGYVFAGEAEGQSERIWFKEQEVDIQDLPDKDLRSLIHVQAAALDNLCSSVEELQKAAQKQNSKLEKTEFLASSGFTLAGLLALPYLKSGAIWSKNGMVRGANFAWSKAPQPKTLLPCVAIGIASYGLDTAVATKKLSGTHKKICSAACMVTGVGLLGLAAESAKNGTYETGTNLQLFSSGILSLIKARALWMAGKKS